MRSYDFGPIEKQWRELQDAGIPLEPLENRYGPGARDVGTGLTIRPGRDQWRSEIRELKNGRFGYILPIFIRRDLAGKTTILDCWIETPWHDQSVDLLEQPREKGRPAESYKLPDDPEPFARTEVVNHRIKCSLSRGDIRTGLLLAVGFPPPDTYTHQGKVVVTCGILDQWDVTHMAKFEMSLIRRAFRPEAVERSTRGLLLSKPDFVAPPSPRAARPAPRDDGPETD